MVLQTIKKITVYPADGDKWKNIPNSDHIMPSLWPRLTIMGPRHIPQDSSGLGGELFNIPESNFIYAGKYWINFFSTKKLD